jgi:hypothetical protein
MKLLFGCGARSHVVGRENANFMLCVVYVVSTQFSSFRFLAVTGSEGMYFGAC